MQTRISFYVDDFTFELREQEYHYSLFYDCYYYSVGFSVLRYNFAKIIHAIVLI